MAKARRVRGKEIPRRRRVESRQTLEHLAFCQKHRAHVSSLVLRCPRSVRLRLVVDHITLLVFVLISACCVDKWDIHRASECPKKGKATAFSLGKRLQQGAEILDRRSEVIKEALPQEIQRGEQRTERSSCVTTAAPAPQFAASTPHELRENRVEPASNPKRRLLMKSASSAASGSGQRRVKRSAADAEPEAQIEMGIDWGRDERLFF